MGPAATLDHEGHGSFDDLGTPLHAVTFCVVDVETTGGSPAACGITEVGAVRLRGGEQLGTFQTLVDPGVPVPPAVATLTGITSAMVAPAPAIDEVLPALLEFVGGAVLVGHNLRFDVAFIDAALAAAGRTPLGHHRVDTVALARRLVRDDPDGLADCRLGTLAERYGLTHQPCHRALDDALATGELLHLLIERAAAFGAYGLDDLLALPRLAGNRQAGKLHLTADLPREPGVYLFRDRTGRSLRVGRATDLRRRVRSHFSPHRDRGTTASLLRETRSIEHVTCASALEAAVLEVRLLHALEPRYDRRARWRSYRYVVRTGGRQPRLAVARTAPGTAPRTARHPVPPATPRAGARVVLGPLPSTAAARQVIAALEPAPAAGGPDPEAAAALARALRRQRQFDALRRAGRVLVELPGGRRVELVRGCLGRAAGGTGERPEGRPELARWLDPGTVAPPPADGPVPLDMADELACVAAWLDRHAADVRLVHVEGELSSPLRDGLSPPVETATRQPGVYADRPCSPRS